MEPVLTHTDKQGLPTPEQLRDCATAALDSMKAVDVTVLDVNQKSSFADWMIVATGTSQRHVKSLANEVVDESKKIGNRPLGTEGETDGNWILVDLGDVLVHVMTREAREFYSLEKLWQVELGSAPELAAAESVVN